MSDIASDTPTLTLETVATPMRVSPSGDGITFAPIVSSLISGERDLVVVDPPLLTEDAEALGAAVDAGGRTLTTVFVTHAHGDHYFGVTPLLERFPDAAFVALPVVAEHVAQRYESDSARLRTSFGDRLAVPSRLPVALTEPGIELEGRTLEVLDMGQADISPTGGLRVPELEALIVGDLAYHTIHPFLAVSNAEQWEQWRTGVLKLADFVPRRIVAGHQRAGTSDADIGAIVSGTADYIRDFAAAVASHDNAADVIEEMLAAYPEHGNPLALYRSAQAAFSSPD